MLRLSSIFSVLSGIVVLRVRQLFKAQFELEIFRFFLYFCCLALTSGWAKFISIPAVPFFYIDLILLAPFYRYSWANILIGLSILTSVIRLIQGFYGFDQLFISVYLLLVNISSFPLSALLTILIAVAISLLLMFVIIWLLPRSYVKINVPVFFLILLICVGVKLQEDNSKNNLIGTSFGYLLGQFHFSEMFYGPYEIPMLSKEAYPGHIGAAYALEHGTDLVLIIVESMGMPNIDEERHKLFSSFRLSEIVKKYDVVEGSVLARGSTIHGEIRELCGGRLPRGLFGGSGDGCIPRVMTHAGYDATAIHANYPKMYGRNEWYPKIGFNNYINTSSPELPYNHFDDRWGSVLDTSLIDWMESRQKPQGNVFEYVLTVSTHLPAVLLPGVSVWGSCRKNMTEHACIHLANLKMVIDKIGTYAIRRKNTTFVIVGDHPPPFVSHASRIGFKDFEVPYVILQPKIILR